jgi:hypothetical protein
VFGNNHADHHSVTQALAHDSSVKYSTAQRPKRSGFEFEKKSRNYATRLEKNRLRHIGAAAAALQQLSTAKDGCSCLCCQRQWESNQPCGSKKNEKGYCNPKKSQPHKTPKSTLFKN